MSGFAASSLANGTTITLYADTHSSGYTGSKVGSFAYSANSNGVLQGVPSINLSDYNPGVPIYIYAVINDGVNTSVYSAYSTKIVPLPNLVGQIVDQFGNPIAGVTVFLDLNNTGQYVAPIYSTSGSDAITTPGDPVAVTNLSGVYYFNDLASYASTDIGYSTFRVYAVMPNPSFTPITPSAGEVSVSNNLPANSSSLVANFSINRLASISGSVFSDLNRNGVQVASDPALGGATVYLDVAGTGSYQTGDPTCITGPSGTYGFFQLTPTNYTAGIITSSTTTSASGATITQHNYVVTQPSSGTYAIPVTSDAQQLTGYTFGVISLATISGTVTSQATTGATNVQAGTIVDLTTPLTGISEPSYNNFASTTGLVLNGPSTTTSNALSLIGSTASNATKSAWYSSPIPATSGFATSFQVAMTGSSASSAGFAFVVQNNASTTATNGSTTYGYGGLTKSLAVVFDATDNQILLESGGNTSASSSIALLTSGQLGFSLSSGSVYTVKVTYLPTDSSGDGVLNVYLSADATNGGTPVISATVNLASLLGLGTGSNAYFGFTAGTSSTGLNVAISSWSLDALTTLTTTTDVNGNYTFTGLMPGTKYTVNQVVSAGQVQASPFNTQGIYSQSTMAALIGSVSGSTAGDFNGDGIPDVAYSYSLTNGSGAAYAIAYALGSGNGGFSAPVTVFLSSMLPTSSAPTLQYPSSTSPAYDSHIAAGHFSSTTHDQIAYLATNAKGGTIVVTYDVLSGTVINAITVQTKSAPAASSTAPLSLSTINNVALGDLNNDGYADISVATYGGIWTIETLQNLTPISTSFKWVNTPSTVATPYVSASTAVTNGVIYTGGVTFADFNQDGNLDVGALSVTYLEGSVYNNASQTYTYAWSNTMTVQTSFQIFYGNGSGVNFAATGSSLSSTGTTTTVGGSQVIQSYTTSDVYFCTAKTLVAPTFPIPFGMAATDITGDGAPDLELNGYNGSLQAAVFLLTQSSPGTFSISAQYPIPAGKTFNINNTPGQNNASIPGSLIVPSQITTVDLNGDGFNDATAVEPNTGQLILLTSQGQPLANSSATQQTLQFTGGALEQFAVADFGLNGYPDIVVPNPTTSLTFTPTEVLNGTINLGVYTYTPTDGQVLTGQNFNDLQFATPATPAITPSSAYDTSGTQVQTPAAQSRGTNVVAGRVYLDQNMNNKYRAYDLGLSGVLVYIDADNSGTYNPKKDVSTVTNAQGYYSFSSLQSGHNYVIRTINPAGTQAASPVTVSFESGAHGNSSVAQRYIGLRPQLFGSSKVSVDPLAPLTIPLGNSQANVRRGAKLQFTFNGSVPEGMTLNPSNGEISWVAPASLEGQTINVPVRVTNLNSASALEFETETVQISVNNQSSRQSLIRAVYGALLFRVPTANELQYWTNLLLSHKSEAPDSVGSAISIPQFVSAVLHSSEASSLQANSLYLAILGRSASPNEQAAVAAYFSQGGNSDALTLHLLTCPEFQAKHVDNSSFVTAVNASLISTGVSSQTVNQEVSALVAGQSRASLVQSIQMSRPAASLKVTQLSSLYLGTTLSPSMSAPLVAGLIKGTLTSDQVAAKILSSTLFQNVAESSGIQVLVNRENGLSPLYDRLNHLVVSLTGQNATRAQLDELHQQQINGMNWQQISDQVDRSQSSQDFRIQSQYQNLLGRPASADELMTLKSSLPPNNQTEAVQVHILSGMEYRSQFTSTQAYINAVYRTLTGHLPTAAVTRNLTRSLNSGSSPLSFVQRLADSKDGQVGQIHREYADLLLRTPSQLDVKELLKSRKLTDASITRKIAPTHEYSRKQQSSRHILPS
jgi:protocatechuate 3,4-dioxygenase beta subunit